MLEQLECQVLLSLSVPVDIGTSHKKTGSVSQIPPRLSKLLKSLIRQDFVETSACRVKRSVSVFKFFFLMYTGLAKSSQNR